MECDRWERIKALFEQAAELSPAGRQACLDVACADDTQLRREIDALLGSHDSSGVLDLSLADFAGVLPPSDIRPAFSNQQVVSERFRILRFLGRGGMGEVYEAEDLVLGGSVALKTLRPEFVTETHLVRRFRREVQLARKVTHPNVCRVFDVGVHSTGNTEIAYLTMEFLEGETLSSRLKYSGRLSPEEALPLIRQMAGGLDALHQASIVHRDFKPGNVILTEDPGGATRAVITDFGLARRAAQEVDETAVSLSGQIFGTPDYMAPEQLFGKPVSPATDVYALGLVMYEMVTGAKPFREGKALETAVQRVTETPVPPTEHAQDLPEALVQTILHCLEKAPEDRPVGAADAVAILESQEHSAAVRPRPKSAQPQVSDGRQLSLSSATATRWRWPAVAAVITIVLALFAWSSRVSQQEAKRMSVAVLPFTTLANDADIQAYADGLMDGITNRLSQFEGTRAQLLVVPASEVWKQHVDSASEARGKLGADYVVEGALTPQGDRVRLTLAVVDTSSMRHLGSSDVEEDRGKALNLQDGALARLANLLDLRISPEEVADYSRLSPASPDASAFYIQGRGYLQRSDKVDQIDLAIALFNRSLDADPESALAHAGLGAAYAYKYDRTNDTQWVDLALTHCRRALELNAQLAEVHVTMGRIYTETGRSKQAVAEYQEALDIEPRSAQAYSGLARAYAELGDTQQAESIFRKALDLRREDWTIYKELGLFYYRQGRYEDAIREFEQVVALTPDNALAYVNIGSFSYYLGRYETAEIYWKRAIDLDPERPTTYSNLGKALFDQERYEEAKTQFEKAISLSQQIPQAWSNLADTYHALGLNREFVEARRHSIALLEEEISRNPKLAHCYSSLAHEYATLGQAKEALANIEKALALEPQNPDVLVRSATAYAVIGLRNEARTLMRQAVVIGYSETALRRNKVLAPLLEHDRELQGKTH